MMDRKETTRVKKVVGCSFLIATVLLAGGLGAPAAHAAHLTYLSPNAVEVNKLLPDPPMPDSFEQRCELEEVKQVHTERSATDIARARSESDLTVFAFANVIGEGFTAEHCPKTAALFEAVESDCKYFEKEGKRYWNRPRPPMDDPSLKPDKEQSYPSGHSTRATAMAEILEQLFPEKKEAIETRGQQIGFDRVILGVHYPSDVLAGRVLGHALGQALLENAKFREDLRAVKAELAAQ